MAMSSSGSQLKMATPEPDKGRKDHGSPDNTSTDGTSLTSGSREDDSVAMTEDLNIFQAILLNNFEAVEHLLDTSRTDYIVHIKATDSLQRYVVGVSSLERHGGSFHACPRPPAQIQFSRLSRSHRPLFPSLQDPSLVPSLTNSRHTFEIIIGRLFSWLVIAEICKWLSSSLAPLRRTLTPLTRMAGPH